MRINSLVAQFTKSSPERKMATDHEHEMIPGLFDSGAHDESNNNMSLSVPVSMTATSGNRDILDELLAEKGSLGPNFAHSIRLLDEGTDFVLYLMCVLLLVITFLRYFFYIEIVRVKNGDKNVGKGYFMLDGNQPQMERIYIPMELQKQVIFHYGLPNFLVSSFLT